MNGIEKITVRIERDARAEIDEILAGAQQKAAEISDRYGAQAAAEAEKTAEAGRKAAQQRFERLEGAADMEAKKMLLSAKQAAIEKAFAKAKETLLGLPDGEYADLLAKLTAGSVGSGSGEVILNARDRKRVGAEVIKKANALLQGRGELTLAEETGDMEGGLVLRSGKVEINCAFETQLRILRDTMAADVAKVLFP